MKRSLLLLWLFLSLSFCTMAQTSGIGKGLYGGISIGYFHYKTNWYYHRGDGNPRYDNYPVHSIDRVVVSLSLEKQAIQKTGSFRFDLGGELLLGPAGKARGLWLPSDDVISSGGWSAGLHGYGRAVFIPSQQTTKIHLFPFFSLGPQYMFNHMNGKGTGPYASEGIYDYKAGWNEGVLMMTGELGVDLQFDDFILTPMLRFGLFGWNTTSWEPNAGGVSMSGGPSLTAFSVRLSKHF